LNIKLLSSWDGIFDGSISSLFLLKTEGYSSLFILQNIDGIGFWPPLSMANTDGHFFEVDGCNLSNTEVFMLSGTSSSSLQSISSMLGH